jgi:hypothetical protein
MFSNKRNLLIVKKFLGISLSNSKSSIRLVNIFNNGITSKRFSAHGTNHHGENHEHGHDSHSEHHDDHHGHHDITGEVDMNKVYVPLSADVKLKIKILEK